MKNLLVVLFLCGIANVHAQDSLSVLFVGNSYIYSNDLPGMLNSLTTSLGDEITYDSKTNGGFTFNSHLNDPQTHVKIKNKPWDVVVLQGQSQEPSFPYAQVNTNTLPQAVQLADSVYANRYCSNAMYFMTWGRENGDPQWDSINTFYKMNDRLRLAYLRIMDSAQASVSPVGSAWRYVRDNDPTIQLYFGDGSHPSVAGTYLAACTFYASLFRKSPVGASYTAGLDPSVAAFLQSAAEITVLDSLELWRLRSNEEIAIAGFNFQQNDANVQFNNTSWRATDFSWDFGDGNTSNEVSPQHVYTAPGIYEAQLIAMNECGDDTISVTVEVLVNGVEENSQRPQLRLLENGIYEVSFFGNVSQIQLLNTMGQVVNNGLSNAENGEKLKVDLNKHVSGVYYLSLNVDGKRHVLKLVR